jgi:hypothetical protein
MADATQLLATQIRVLAARLEEARTSDGKFAVSLALWPEKSDVDARNSNVCFNPMNRHHPRAATSETCQRTHVPQQTPSPIDNFFDRAGASLREFEFASALEVQPARPKKRTQTGQFSVMF